MPKKLQVQLVFEILGKPAEHIKEAIRTIVTRLGSEKGVAIIEKKYHDPVLAEGSKELYATFAEVTLEMETIGNLFGIIFAYLPSHIELISPSNIKLANHELNEFANTLAHRLHGYDAITKRIINERDIFAKNLEKFAPQIFQQITSQDPKMAKSPLEPEKAKSKDETKTKDKAKKKKSKKKKKE